MSVDLSQFHQVFFEESNEGLDIMESALLELDPEALDSERIDEIFRAAHSIKGGSGTFGFQQIADFTHVVETLLDLIRSDQFDIQSEHVDLFLRSVDCIRTMVNQLEDGQECETELAGQLKAEFEAILNARDGQGADTPSADSVGDGARDSGSKGWQIYFRPDADILRTGNEPIRMFRELQELGPIEVQADCSGIPKLSNIEPEACYSAWNISLFADVEKTKVEEVFEWVVDESELTIDPLDLSNLPSAKQVGADSTDAVSVAPEASVGDSADTPLSVQSADVPIAAATESA
ncbi:Hpt domain-containing protein, partial [Oleiphilus sp. HI0079]